MEIIVCDFDGTITNIDFLAKLFDTYCPIKKIETELLCINGVITHTQQINMCLEDVKNQNISLKKLIDTSNIIVDPFFKEWYHSLNKPFYIISAGLRLVIQYLLDYVKECEIFANELDLDSWNITTNICKIEIIQKLKQIHPNHKIVYYGDGMSDFKVSHFVDDLKIKKNCTLEKHARYCNLKYTTFTNFPLDPCTKRVIHVGCGRLFMGFIKPYFSNSNSILHIRSDKCVFGEMVQSRDTCFIGSLEELCLKLKNSKELIFTISVGSESFDGVYSKIYTAFPEACILAFENHLLYKPVVLKNLHVCFADKICSSIQKTITVHDRVEINVTTESYNGTLLLPNSCKTILSTFLDVAHFTFVDKYDIYRHGLQKKLSINTIQFIISCFAETDMLDYINLKPALLRLLALACIHLKNETGMSLVDAMDIYSQTIKRLRYSKDTVVRIQRNIHSKIHLIKFLY